MHLKWLSFSCIFSGVLILTSWVCGESITASNLTVANRQSQNGQNNTMNDSIAVEKITFYSERSGNAEVYIMNADGSGLKRLTTNSALDNGAAISPDGSKIAFSSTRDGNYEIYVMNTDGSNQQRLTNTPYNEVHADWSPDGSKIAYALFIDPSYEDGDIYVMDADGSNKQQLTSDPAKDMRPIWSSDGSKIIFNSTKDGNHEIYTMNAYGSNQQRITNTEVDELFPCYSPDMTKIVYALVNFQTIKAEVHVMNADGTGDTALTNTGGINEDAIWSPDGKEIVFQSDRDGNFEVYIMAANGSNPRRLTNHPSWDGFPDWGVVRVPLKKYLGQTPPDSIPIRFPPSSLLSDGVWWWHGSPVFSPEGTEMYFVKYIDATDKMEMYYMEIDQNGEWTSPQTPSFASDSLDNSPVFADDGNRLLFTSNREGVTRIYQVSRTDSGWSEPQSVDMDYQSLPGRLGWFFSMTRDETIYFEIFDSTDQNIYRSGLVNGRYSTFEKLPDMINSTYGDLRPYIDPDEQYLIFASNRPGGFGSFDLYISYKNPDGSWSTAQNLGNRINGTQAEDMAFVTPEGKYFFFTTTKSGDLGPNPYWVDASLLCRSGDADNSGSIDVSDVIYLINYLFRGGPAPIPSIAGDCNNDNNVSVSDVVYLINYLLKGGPKPEC